jgi:hypothetical protein
MRANGRGNLRRAGVGRRRVAFYRRLRGLEPTRQQSPSLNCLDEERDRQERICRGSANQSRPSEPRREAPDQQTEHRYGLLGMNTQKVRDSKIPTAVTRLPGYVNDLEAARRDDYPDAGAQARRAAPIRPHIAKEPGSRQCEQQRTVSRQGWLAMHEFRHDFVPAGLRRQLAHADVPTAPRRPNTARTTQYVKNPTGPNKNVTGRQSNSKTGFKHSFMPRRTIQLPTNRSNAINHGEQHRDDEAGQSWYPELQAMHE